MSFWRDFPFQYATDLMFANLNTKNKLFSEIEAQRSFDFVPYTHEDFEYAAKRLREIAGIPTIAAEQSGEVK